MPLFNLSTYQINKIKRSIDQIYEKLKERLLARGSNADSLVNVYELASLEERNRPDEDSLKSLISISEGYINSQKEITKTRIIQAIDTAIKDEKIGNNKDGFEELLVSNLVEVFNKAIVDMRAIIAHQANNIKNIGLLNGIIKVSAALSIGDPVVYFSAIKDEKTCKECVRLHFFNDTLIPRLWRLSSIKSGYAKRGDTGPALGGQHPACRGSLSMLAPGFGFSPNGAVLFVGMGHSEIDKQEL